MPRLTESIELGAILRAANAFFAVSAASAIAFKCERLPCHLQNGVLQ